MSQYSFSGSIRCRAIGTLKGTSDLFDNIKKLKKTYVRLHLVDVIPAEDLKGKTTVEIAEQVHAMMLADLGEEYRIEE